MNGFANAHMHTLETFANKPIPTFITHVSKRE